MNDIGNNIPKVKQSDSLVSISGGEKELFVKTINAFRARWAARNEKAVYLNFIKASDLNNMVNRLTVIKENELEALVKKCPAYDKTFFDECDAMKEKMGDILAPLKSINKNRADAKLTQIGKEDYIRIILSDQIWQTENKEESKKPADASKVAGEFKKKIFLV